jgi:hypothetical protein
VGADGSGDDRDVAAVLVGVHPVPRLPRRGLQADLHVQRDRVPQRPLPRRHPATRPVPRRAVSVEGALPRSPRETAQPTQPDRPDQRLEEHPQRLVHDLRRPPRAQLARAPHAENLTDPKKALEVARTAVRAERLDAAGEFDTMAWLHDPHIDAFTVIVEQYKPTGAP